jgi:predicted transcriptional regulator YdeE
MNYKIVTLEEKTVAGVKTRTSNSSPSMTQEIGRVWEKFYAEGVYASIPDKVNDNAIGLYTNYETDVTGAYDMVVCCEIGKQENLPDGLDVKVIPAGKYARFVVHGDSKAVGNCWGEIWQTKLDRKFDCDFEEYQSGDDMENMEIHIYISLN